MSRSFIVPCVWFDDQAEAAASFYTRLFPQGRINARSYYPEKGDNPSGRPPGSVLTVEFEIAGQHFTALNGGPMFKPNPSISFFVHVGSAAEADRLFGALSDGGTVLMPLGEYPWSKRYGWVQDRFGVSFQVMWNAEDARSGIVPCLMFAGAQRGKAEQAIQAYTRIFTSGRIELIERYKPGESGPAGLIKHARFELSGHPMAAMDSGVEQDVSFDEGLSLQVMCKDQREIDRYWSALSDGGEEAPCGWLKDRFGVSWQVVPSGIVEWLTSTDTRARDRAFEAVMQMKKLDIAAIEAAYRGA